MLSVLQTSAQVTVPADLSVTLLKHVATVCCSYKNLSAWLLYSPIYTLTLSSTQFEFRRVMKVVHVADAVLGLHTRLCCNEVSLELSKTAILASHHLMPEQVISLVEMTALEQASKLLHPCCQGAPLQTQL